MSDLFEGGAARAQDQYSAEDIEVLEGLEPVRKRPGMYIGGTDERALHHLVAEVLDNAMDEAVAGHATRIDLELLGDGSITVRDNGRGIPVDEHPKFPGKSALEVILTTLHSGGKFSGKAYATSGGLHGVGISVVNALSDSMVVEVARDQALFRQSFARGTPQGALESLGATRNRRGTTVTFHADPEIFGPLRLKPERLYKMARSKAYLFRGVEIRWATDAGLIREDAPCPEKEILHFPNGLRDYLSGALEGRESVTGEPFAGEAAFPDGAGRLEWAIAWPEDEEGFCNSYCNTVPTPQGGTHEAGMRTALVRALKGWGELVGNKKAAAITADDVVGAACILLSAFIREPQFQGQTKEKLASSEATRQVDNALKDQMDLWLSANSAAANALLAHIILRAEERMRKKDAKETKRKTATRRLRLPGKLADCAKSAAEGTEIFIVEGDSAGGSAKQARSRDTQAILPLRGKILNVASASMDKLKANQEIQDLLLALGCGTGKEFRLDDLRYEKIIIMTDADVDGAHIASLLMTFFYRMMPGLIRSGRLYLALPPLYRMVQGTKSLYAMTDMEREQLLETEFRKDRKIDISRFKGLGEMPPAALKVTTMDPKTRTLMRVQLPDHRNPEEADAAQATADLVEQLMGRDAAPRFRFIQENAEFATDLDI